MSRNGPVYGLEVPPGGILIPASNKFPVPMRITMAALDPTMEPEADEDGKIPAVPRSTLRIIKRSMDDDDDGDDMDEDFMKALMSPDDDEDDGLDEDSDDDDDDEPNGGPSDPSKAKQQRASAALKKLQEAAKDDGSDEDSDEDMEDGLSNGLKLDKGKGKAIDNGLLDSDEDDSEDGGDDMEHFVVCTLDTERHYQQPLDLVVSEDEKVYFLVSGTHTVYLTGNYILPDYSEDDDDDEDDEDEYDMSPDELEYGDMSDDESDELDSLANPRVEELGSDEEDEAPALVPAATAKGKNKRPAEDDVDGLDGMIAQEMEVEKPKLSKKQLKKLKNNKGDAVAAEAAKPTTKEGGAAVKPDKKVQFANQLEQGPTGSAEKAKNGKPAKTATPAVKNVQGVTIDDRVIGNGRQVKQGDKVGLRYIGKLTDGKVFDANKKGKPFSFTVGKGEVIKGWDIGIKGMAVGGERRLTIPANMAYGSKSMAGIPSNSTLLFDVKLLEIK